MSLLRRFPKLSFTLVLLSIVGISVAQRSVGLLLIAGALAAMSWYLTEGPRGRWLPRWVSNVLVIAVTLNVIVEIIQSPDDLLNALGRFVLWLMIIKLYERRTARDHAQLLGLSLLLMIAGSLMSVDLFFGLVLAAYAALGLYVLVLYQLHASHEQVRIQRLASIPQDYRLVPSVRPITGRHVTGHFRSLVFALAASGFLLGMTVFMVFPRGIGQGMLATMPMPHRDYRSGYKDEIDLFIGGRITDSRRAVMTVRLLDKNGQPFIAKDPILLRGAVLDRYEGRGRWRAPQDDPIQLQTQLGDFVSLLPDFAEIDDATPVITQQFNLIQGIDTIFAMYLPVAISTDAAQSLGLDTRRLTLRQDTSRAAAIPIKRYTVQSVPLPGDQLLPALDTPSGPVPSLSPQIHDPAVTDLARQLLIDAGLPPSPPGPPESFERYQWHADAASVFTSFLQSSSFHYTTDLSGVVIPEQPGRHLRYPVDPISYFLLDLRRGHCEYFASGLAFLCLHVEIPARVITGFVAHEYDAVNQRYNVVEANAHAWVEVRTGQHQWSTFDPTPPAILRTQHAGANTVTDRLRWFYDSFDGAWNRTVVEFDRNQQTRITRSGLTATLTQRAKRAWHDVREWLYRVNAAFHLGPAGYIWMAFVACILVVAIAVLIKLMRRSRAIKQTLQLQHVRGKEYQRMLRQLGFYLDMLDVLQRGGLEKPQWQPPMDYADHLAQHVGDESTIVRLISAVTTLFYEARYGGKMLTNDQTAHAHAMVRELALALNVRPKRAFFNVQ